MYTKNHDHSKDEEATTSEVTGNAAHNLYSVPGTEPEVITFDLNVLQDSDVILLDDPKRDAGDRQDHGALEITGEYFRIEPGQEDQGSTVAQDVVSLVPCSTPAGV